MALCFRYNAMVVFYLNLAVIITFARTQSPATNEQPWASILYTAVVKGKVALPCDISPPSSDDSVALILWYKDEALGPIYTLDARRGNVDQARQVSSPELENRAYFNMINRPAFLQLDPVREEDAGEYRCRVDFKKARTVNTVITLKVIVPPGEPVITDAKGKELKGLVGPFNEGDSLKLICEAEGGKPRPAVTWWREYTLLDDTYTFVPDNVVRNELVIQEIHRHDLLAVLTCQASNNNITVAASSAITLDLNLKPVEVVIHSPKHPLTADKEVELVCTSSGSRPSAVITWWKGSKKMRTTKEKVVQSSGMSTSVLTFVPTMEDHGKHLSCRAENPLIPGSALEEGWKLEVYYVPQLSLQLGTNLKTSSIQEGNDVYFECNIRSNPWVTDIRWQFEGKELHTNTSFGIIISNQSLVLQRVQRTSSGRYTCMASNSQGTGVSNEVLLQIKYAPVCKANQKVIYGIAIHESTQIACELEANPSDITFHWAFNNSFGYKEITSFTNDEARSVASFMPQTEDDYGALLCWGSNDVGLQRDPCIYTIIPAGPPNPVQNCTVTNTSEDALVLECLEGYDGGLTQHFVMEVYDVDKHTLQANITSQHQPVFFAQNLPAGINIRIVVYAVNAKGRGPSIAIATSTLRPAEKLTGVQGIVIIRPVLGLLIGVVASLIIAAIIILIIIKLRSRRKGKVSRGERGDADKSDTPLKKDVDDSGDTAEKGPDIIPAKNLNAEFDTGSGETSLALSSMMDGYCSTFSPSRETFGEGIGNHKNFASKKKEEVTYAELALPKCGQQRPPPVRRQDPPTEYAQIDFHRRVKVLPTPVEHEEEEGGLTCETPLMNERRESTV